MDVGMTLLAQEGHAALRIDRLAAILALSKGSFYHHFAGISGYRLDLLDHYESRFTTRHIAVAEGLADVGPRERLDRLRASVLAEQEGGAELDTAVRSWAAHDDDARATLERVDARRLDYLRDLWREISDDADEAEDVSRMLYLLLIGSYHLVPPLSGEQLGRLWDRVLGPVGPPAGRPA
jgi:AcrR family transcriptional regulator